MRIQNPRVFHLKQKLAVILTLSFIQKTKIQKNDWKLCQPLLHNKRVSLVGYLKYSLFKMMSLLIVTHTE